MQNHTYEQDCHFMQMALDLAKQGIYTTTPNPAVGCVLVKDNQIIGKGFHFKAGQPHAEVMALRDANNKKNEVLGATAYVTLEPCSHFGRTPPCAQGLIDAEVKRVVIAMQDPNPQVAGKGIAMLENAGISTTINVLAEQAELLNKGFLTRMRSGKPLVQLKMAMSIDGKTAMANGESKWITGELARQDVQHLRAQASAILSTSQTVLADDPLLNVRHEQFSLALQKQYLKAHLRQPIRVILDNHHQVQPRHRLFQIKSPVWLVSHTERDLSAFPSNCQQIILNSSGKSDLLQLMEILGYKQINSVWVEAGAKLAGSLIEEKLVDELILYIAPKLLGHEARDLCYLPNIKTLSNAIYWKLNNIETFGSDIKICYQKQL